MSRPLQPYTSFPIQNNEDNSQGNKVSSIDSMLIGNVPNSTMLSDM